MENEKNPSAELLAEMYRNTEMSCDSINSVINKITKKDMLTSLTDMILKSSDYSKKTAELSHQRGITPKEISKMKKLSVEAGIAVNTAFDQTDSHIAEMVARGMDMGAAQLDELCTKLSPSDPPVVDLCNQIVAFEKEAAQSISKFE